MSTRQRIVYGTSVTLVGILMFVIASSYVVDHKYSKWLALALGLFAFPIAPGVWHFLGERKRARKVAAAKSPPKSSLTGSDRLWLRIAAVAVIVLGPMIVKSKFGVLGGVWRHGLWFVPTPAKSLVSERESLLRYVPDDAELVITIHKAADDKSPAGNAIIAWGGGEALMIADEAIAKKGEVKDQLQQLNAMRETATKWLPVKKLDLVSSSGLVIVASEQWRGKLYLPTGGANPALRDALDRASKSAPFVAAFVPKTVQRTTKTGTVWASVSDDGITIDARIEEVDAAAAKALADKAGKLAASATADLPANCKDQVGKLGDKVKIDVTGAVITAHLAVPKDDLVGLMVCAM